MFKLRNFVSSALVVALVTGAFHVCKQSVYDVPKKKRTDTSAAMYAKALTGIVDDLKSIDQQRQTVQQEQLFPLWDRPVERRQLEQGAKILRAVADSMEKALKADDCLFTRTHCNE